MSFDKPHIIVALDVDTAEQALVLARRLSPTLCRLKIGKELFTAAGPQLVSQIIALGYDVFLDLKFHDIPNTVAKACRAAANLGVWMLNVHASGGTAMLEAARDSLADIASKPLLIAVTVLTSLSDSDLHNIGSQLSAKQMVLQLAALTQQAGLDGVVCSAQEAANLKQHFGQDFCLVTPGIRPLHSASNDQKRTMTPAEALAAGSDYLVIGRPITGASDPLVALEAISESIITD